eukprot:CAMPEP_0117680914 /NCGR_PEP_ID=MMETSP0804-20121206/18643_1 /TAXON_ID=1074897 /ORGANISM="Tetraselmis astigmatica, Strain CCMP880" /LENGTH=32 /DNA_ID= /DNA_START= /DNA_END= /DNA_ORIENTATION=
MPVLSPRRSSPPTSHRPNPQGWRRSPLYDKGS